MNRLPSLGDKSSAKQGGSRPSLGLNKTWKGRTSKHVEQRINAGANVDAPTNDAVGSIDVERAVDQSQSTALYHGGLHSQPQHQTSQHQISISQNTNREQPVALVGRKKQDVFEVSPIQCQPIGAIDHLEAPISSSSDQAVLAFAGSSSYEEPFTRNYISQPSVTSNSGAPRPPHQASLTGSGALETSYDKLDEGNLSQWWFLSSKSESFDSAVVYNVGQEQALKNETRHDNTAQHNTSHIRSIANKGSNESIKSNKKWTFRGGRMSPMLKLQTRGNVSGTDSPSGKGAMYELPSRNTSSLSSKSPRSTPQQVFAISTSSKKPQPAQQRQHLNYILKEQKLRAQWLTGMGGADLESISKEYSEEPQSNAPYHFIPVETKDSQHQLYTIDTSKPKTKKGASVDWTPQDSSYGAAVQAFGWVPKRIRKLIETFFFILIMTGLIYGVVKSMYVLTASTTSSGSGGGDIDWVDDDHYLANNQQNLEVDDEDNADGP